MKSENTTYKEEIEKRKAESGNSEWLGSSAHNRKAESGIQRTEVGSLTSEVRGQRSGIGRLRTEDRRRRAEVKDQTSVVSGDMEEMRRNEVNSVSQQLQDEQLVLNTMMQALRVSPMFLRPERSRSRGVGDRRRRRGICRG